eukprot:UN26746
MVCCDRKNDHLERREMLTNLPDVHRLNRSSDREVDRFMYYKLKQFIWPKSDFDVGQKLDVPAKVYVLIILGLFWAFHSFILSIDDWSSQYDDRKKYIEALGIECIDDNVGVFTMCLYFARDNAVQDVGDADTTLANTKEELDRCIDRLDEYMETGDGCNYFAKEHNPNGGYCHDEKMQEFCPMTCGNCTRNEYARQDVR